MQWFLQQHIQQWGAERKLPFLLSIGIWMLLMDTLSLLFFINCPFEGTLNCLWQSLQNSFCNSVCPQQHFGAPDAGHIIWCTGHSYEECLLSRLPIGLLICVLEKYRASGNHEVLDVWEHFYPHDCCVPFFIYKIFIRIYSLYGGGFIVTILIRLILYITYIAPLSVPLNPVPTPLKAIIGDFLFVFHIGIWSPSTIYYHLNLLAVSLE
jgi:hypothetical protein